MTLPGTLTIWQYLISQPVLGVRARQVHEASKAADISSIAAYTSFPTIGFNKCAAR